ncbi:MAG TPA: N-acetyltransferase [Rubrobacter sp.]|nr:N-acetyltransferase [Rubrobacter sp.]
MVGTVQAEEEPYRRTRHSVGVEALWVHGSWRRRGVTGRLLATLIAWAQAHLEVEKLGLYVFSTNEAAVRLYQKPGFLIEAETQEPCSSRTTATRTRWPWGCCWSRPVPRRRQPDPERFRSSLRGAMVPAGATFASPPLRSDGD